MGDGILQGRYLSSRSRFFYFSLILVLARSGLGMDDDFSLRWGKVNRFEGFY